MNVFVKNKINTDFDLISKELIRARQEKKLSLEDVSSKTKINVEYLIALEKGDFSLLPEGLYGKNFLKQYSRFLGLSLDNILEIYDEANEIKKEPDKNLFSNQVVKNKYFLAIPSLLRNLIIISIVFVFFSYLLFSIKKLNSMPSLEITYPPDNFITTESSVTIKGQTEYGINISINGDNVLVGSDGEFSQGVHLKIGINEIIVEAKKKYGRINIVKKQILLKN